MGFLALSVVSSQQPTNPGNYHLNVQDFGPVARAEVDLRPLTIFVGPSNTGKSYLAVLIYALHQCLADERVDVPGFGYSRFTLQRATYDIEAKEEVWEALEKWASPDVRNERLDSLPESANALIRSFLERPSGLDAMVAAEIARCFGIDELRELHRRPGRSDSLIEIRVPVADTLHEARYDLQLRKTGVELRGSFDEVEMPAPFREESDNPMLWSLRALLAGRTDESKRYRQILIAHLAEQQFRSMLRPICAKAHYLPADRTGIMHAHQVVVGTLVQSATTAGLRPSTHVPTLSGVLADFLNALIRVGSGDRRREIVAGLAEALEGNVLGGSVRMDSSETGYPAFFYRPSHWTDDLPLMRASSMVSELAPVVLYLRHVVRPGDVLIIEEPEAHLHPAMQTALARELARLVRSGIRIVMTTHSEWFLEQIGNLVCLSSLPRVKRNGILGADVALDTEEVGAWLFRPSKRPQGSIVEEAKLDPETGLFATDYDSVSETLYNESAAIYNRSKGSSE